MSSSRTRPGSARGNDTEPTFIIGVSGGADSMCLLHMLTNGACLVGAAISRPPSKENIVVTHLNHSLRPTANTDEAFVKQYCLTHNIEFVSRKVDVAKYAADNKISLETAGRVLRYEFFSDIAKEHKNPTILTAHNKNDSVESFVMHLLRGASLSGLCGIREWSKFPSAGGVDAKRTGWFPFKNIDIWRPLIHTSRAEIEAYNKENNVPYIEDETNSDTAFRRNEIRHNLMPLLDIEMISKAISRLQVDEDYLREVANELVGATISRPNFEANAPEIVGDAVSGVPNIEENTFTFDAKWFNSFHLSLKRRIIHTLCRRFTTQTISNERIDEAITAVEKNVGNKTIQFPERVTLSIRKGKIEIKQKSV